MSKNLRIALAQINVTVGDFANNEKKIIEYIHKAKRQKTNLIVFPEFTIMGYPPEDLLLRPQFIQDNLKCLQRIITETKDISAIIGFADLIRNKLFNSAAILNNCQLAGVYHKMNLPNYGVFDEKRYFGTGEEAIGFDLKNIKIGVSICEDLWIPNSAIESAALVGEAEIIINISASPFCSGKIAERENLLIDRAVKNRIVMIYVNLIGGQDELVFDGSSLIVNEKGVVLARCKQFDEDLLFYDIDISSVEIIRKSDGKFQQRKKEFPPKKLNTFKLNYSKIFKKTKLPARQHADKKLD